jgi:hypothetical protein
MLFALFIKGERILASRLDGGVRWYSGTDQRLLALCILCDLSTHPGVYKCPCPSCPKKVFSIGLDSSSFMLYPMALTGQIP